MRMSRAKPRCGAIIAFVAALGVGVATYITIADSGGGAPDLPGRRRRLRDRRQSSYSHIAGVNVAIFGIVGYVALLATAFFANDAARFGGFALALGGFGFSIYLTYLEIFKIEAICQWCVASAVLMTILFLLNATRLIGYAGTDDRRGAAKQDLRPATTTGGTDEQQAGAGEAARRAAAGRTQGRQPATAASGCCRSAPAPSSWSIVAVVVLIVVNASSSDSGGDARTRGSRRRSTSCSTGFLRKAWCSGDPTAPVELIEFGDLQCPVCKAYSEEVLPHDDRRAGQEGRSEDRSSATSRSSAKNRSRPAPPRSPPATRAAAGTSSSSSTATRAKSAPATSTDEFLDRDRQRRRASRTSPNGTRNARARSRPKEVEATTEEAQQFGFNGTPSFAIKGPSTNGLELLRNIGSAGELEEAIEDAS